MILSSSPQTKSADAAFRKFIPFKPHHESHASVYLAKKDEVLSSPEYAKLKDNFTDKLSNFAKAYYNDDHPFWKIREMQREFIDEWNTLFAPYNYMTDKLYLCHIEFFKIYNECLCNY